MFVKALAISSATAEVAAGSADEPFWVVDGRRVSRELAEYTVLVSLDKSGDSDPIGDYDPFVDSVILCREDIGDLLADPLGMDFCDLVGVVINKPTSGPFQSIHFTGHRVQIFVPGDGASGSDAVHGLGNFTSKTGRWAGWGKQQIENEIARGSWGCIQMSRADVAQLLQLKREEMLPSVISKCPSKQLPMFSPPVAALSPARAIDEPKNRSQRHKTRFRSR